jgi:hypothetical protein
VITAIVLVRVESDRIPEVARGDRRPRGSQRGLLRHRRRRPDRDGAGEGERGSGRGPRSAHDPLPGHALVTGLA